MAKKLPRCPLLPLGDRVVLLPDPPATASGRIVTPEKWQQPADRGTIVRRGPGGFDAAGERVPLDDALQPGAHVVFARIRGMQVTEGERVWLLLHEADILALVP